MSNAARWNRLAMTLAQAGKSALIQRVGDDGRQIVYRCGDVRVIVSDTWWKDMWTGWQVWIENAESIVEKEYPKSKNRNAVTRDVLAALKDEPMIPGLNMSVRQAQQYAESFPNESQNDSKRVAQGETRARSAGSSEKPSGSHAACAHEPTKSARAKCRRERSNA